jgi:hypothetical protein
METVIVMTNGRVSTIINEIVNSIASVNNWKTTWNPKRINFFNDKKRKQH